MDGEHDLRVLFVDDEPRVLEGLVRALFDLDWDVETANSGQEALEKLEGASFDVVVSDMRMPGMDGAELLRRVKDTYPEVVRVILSGHAEVDAALRAVPVAHQFLSKPCNRTKLIAVIERAQALIILMGDERLRGVVGRIAQLPAVPETYVRLRETTARADSSIMDVARVVESDVAMTAKVLQLVNSSFFSQATNVSSVEQAVLRLGADMMKSLALATHVFDGSSQGDGELTAFLAREQRHALLVASAARALCVDRSLAELSFLSGVVHDIGKVVLRIGDPEGARAATQKQQHDAVPLHLAERELLGVTHAEVGAYLVGIWGLPHAVCEAIAHHHSLERIAPNGESPVASAVYLANAILADDPSVDDAFAHFGLSDMQEELRAQVRSEEDH